MISTATHYRCQYCGQVKGMDHHVCSPQPAQPPLADRVALLEREVAEISRRLEMRALEAAAND